MYAIKRSGSAAAAARQVRDIPARVVPYAASSALTKTAQAAVPAIVAEMRRVFHEPVPYTLNALRVVPSTIETMTARVAVKDQVSRGTRPESYLLPEVEGGARSPKAIELALRYAGILRANEYVVPGADAPLDAAGNLSGAFLRGLLRQLQANKGSTAAKATKKKSKPGAVYFAGPVGRRGARGIWQRVGRTVRPILIFTTRAPGYRRRLPFVDIAERTARDEFPQLFNAAVEAILAKGAR